MNKLTLEYYDSEKAKKVTLDAQEYLQKIISQMNANMKSQERNAKIDDFLKDEASK
jgi:hypothetical protein